MSIARELRAVLQQWRLRRALYRQFPDVVVEPYVMIKGPLRNLHLGRRVSIQSGCVLHLGGARWCLGTGSLEIGDDAVVSPNSIIYAAGPSGVRIGKNFDCGPGVGIFASRTDYNAMETAHIFQPVTIGDSVTLFANVVVSPGVTIGDGAAVAAGAVVTSDVPANCLVGGIPARILKTGIRR